MSRFGWLDDLRSRGEYLEERRHERVLDKQQRAKRMAEQSWGEFFRDFGKNVLVWGTAVTVVMLVLWLISRG